LPVTSTVPAVVGEYGKCVWDAWMSVAGVVEPPLASAISPEIMTDDPNLALPSPASLETEPGTNARMASTEPRVNRKIIRVKRTSHQTSMPDA
jgi:hypothetical protein